MAEVFESEWWSDQHHIIPLPPPKIALQEASIASQFQSSAEHTNIGIANGRNAHG